MSFFSTITLFKSWLFLLLFILDNKTEEEKEKFFLKKNGTGETEPRILQVQGTATFLQLKVVPETFFFSRIFEKSLNLGKTPQKKKLRILWLSSVSAYCFPTFRARLVLSNRPTFLIPIKCLLVGSIKTTPLPSHARLWRWLGFCYVLTTPDSFGFYLVYFLTKTMRESLGFIRFLFSLLHLLLSSF